MSGLLVVNAGSSTLKLALVAGGACVEREIVHDRWDGEVGSLVAEFLGESGPQEITAVGHRIVHGGHRDRPVLLTDEVVGELAALTDLAPLHQPQALAAVAATRRTLPDVPHLACFDTAFHTTLEPAASTYALPADWRARWVLRRHGFHGLSHAWVARHAPPLVGLEPRRCRIVSCHLGAGASACAIDGGRSVDTTMGFTPLDGLVMATRSGAVDPGLLLWLLRSGRVDLDDVAEGLELRAGLAGLSETDGDMRHVLTARAADEPEAMLAFDVYVHRLRGAIAAMAASLGGVDLLVFTGGVGIHEPAVRAAAVEKLGFLGLAVDPGANARALGDTDVTGSGATARVVVVTAREDLEIADQVLAALPHR